MRSHIIDAICNNEDAFSKVCDAIKSIGVTDPLTGLSILKKISEDDFSFLNIKFDSDDDLVKSASALAEASKALSTVSKRPYGDTIRDAIDIIERSLPSSVAGIKKKASDVGISWRTMRRAALALGVVKVRRGSRWRWSRAAAKQEHKHKQHRQCKNAKDWVEEDCLKEFISPTSFTFEGSCDGVNKVSMSDIKYPDCHFIGREWVTASKTHPFARGRRRYNLSISVVPTKFLVMESFYHHPLCRDFPDIDVKYRTNNRGDVNVGNLLLPNAKAVVDVLLSRGWNPIKGIGTRKTADHLYIKMSSHPKATQKGLINLNRYLLELMHGHVLDEPSCAILPNFAERVRSEDIQSIMTDLWGADEVRRKTKS